MLHKSDCEVGILVRYKGELFKLASSPFVNKAGRYVINLHPRDGKVGSRKKQAPMDAVDIYPTEEEIRQMCDEMLDSDTEAGRRKRLNKARDMHPSYESPVEVTQAILPRSFAKQWTD